MRPVARTFNHGARSLSLSLPSPVFFPAPPRIAACPRGTPMFCETYRATFPDREIAGIFGLEVRAPPQMFGDGIWMDFWGVGGWFLEGLERASEAEFFIF